MAADPLDVVTMDEARDALRLGQTDTQLQPQLERIITSASELLDEHFGPMVQRTVTERHGAAGTIQLMAYPVVSVTSVTVDGTVVDPSEYELVLHGNRSYGELLRLSGGVRAPWRTVYPQGVTVVFVAGRMASTTADTKLARHCKQGALLQIQHMWRPTQHGVGQTDEFDTAAVFANTQGMARGLQQHFFGQRRLGIA